MVLEGAVKELQEFADADLDDGAEIVRQAAGLCWVDPGAELGALCDNSFEKVLDTSYPTATNDWSVRK